MDSQEAFCRYVQFVHDTAWADEKKWKTICQLVRAFLGQPGTERLGLWFEIGVPWMYDGGVSPGDVSDMYYDARRKELGKWLREKEEVDAMRQHIPEQYLSGGEDA